MMLLAPTQPQKPRATQSTWLVNPERSPRTTQSGNATSVHPEASKIAEADRASNVRPGNSSTVQSDSFSNTHLPRQDHALPVAASRSPFPATPDVSTFSGTPLLVVQANGAAKVEGPVPSPSAFASHTVNNPAPYPSNSILIDPELFRQAHAHLSDDQLSQSHADASRSEEKQILMQMLIDRRQGKLQR
ncbi:hypothetical protein MPH_07019 [Macrophomina phaseolina MS6]|uniref:Uncharacterized protein n=1 Tax=Macrophomina phaseolina (strain MS6) TaxID=1126212 RepID=K2RZH9_MACPH|nr:hypothetical protein MPH_07019 [Macrophomina phaseolina MS6]